VQPQTFERVVVHEREHEDGALTGGNRGRIWGQ
jgi:hypothetical protein